MAIISDVPGLKVEVMVHGRPLDEFPCDDEPDAPDTVTRYIEATSGANFTVDIAFDEALDPKYKGSDISSQLFLDGQSAYKCTTTYRERRTGQREGRLQMAGFQSLEDGKWYLRSMAFSQVNIVDENDRTVRPVAEIDAIRSLGEIKITFRRSKVLPKPQPSSNRKVSNSDSLKIIDRIPEKKLKGRAISHQVKLGEAKLLGYPSNKSTYTKHIDDEPFATFLFRYRSRDALKAECIISRTVSPEPLENRPVETLTAQEARELVRRLRDQQEARQSPPPGVKREVKQEVKQEVNEEFDRGKRRSDVDVVDLGSQDSDVEITSVRTLKRQRTSRPVEVIDLSDD